ncbi:MAG TPA: radical SAM protein [archaeon]|nr:radical SAM protein [archaeon]
MVNAYPQAIEKTHENFLEVATSPYVKDYTAERKQVLLAHVPADSKLLKFHQSLCPPCVDEEKWEKMKVDALTYARDGKVWLVKNCPEHGSVRELYWGDYDMFKKAEKFQDPGIKILNPNIDKSEFEIDCPNDCGLCVEHESHTGLGNIVLTNRCDLTCWYCFFYAKEGEPIYEPTLDQIKFMLKRMRDEKPVGANAVQLTGGEPTLRKDLVDIIKAGREIGYDHIQLNTNGINLSRDPQLAQDIHDAGSHILYMSFDGMTPATNPKNYWEAQGALDSCKKAGIGIVLVPTVIGGVNDHELGDIIRFAAGNIDVIRSVNFQPVSLVGRMPEKLRMQQRITIPGAIKRIEEQTDGQIGREFWFPVPCAKQITDFIEALKSEPKYRLSIHFACGMATYVFKEEGTGKLVPLPKFFDVENFFSYLGELTRDIQTARFKKVGKALAVGKLMTKFNTFVDKKYVPKGLHIKRMLMGAMQGSNYHGLADFHHNSLFLGMMHFQDPYNWDIDRIHKCDIHYASPDGRVIPFCTFNVIPELYRDSIQRKFSIPASQWEQTTGKKLIEDKIHRKLTPEQMNAIKTTYDKYRRSLTKVTPEPDWSYKAIKEHEAFAAANQGTKLTSQLPAVVAQQKIQGLINIVAPGTVTKKPTMPNPAGGGGCGSSSEEDSGCCGGGSDSQGGCGCGH